MDSTTFRTRTRLRTFINLFSTAVSKIQPTNSGSWLRLAPRQSIADVERDIEDRYLPPIRNSGSSSSTPTTDSDSESSASPTEFSAPSSQFTFSPFTLSPATWTPQETTPITSRAPSVNFEFDADNLDMTDLSSASFTGKPEDQDPQDFMNRLERIILMKVGLTEFDKVRYLELSLKSKSPAAVWFTTLTSADKLTFTAVRTAFELHWPVKPITEKTTAEKQALLDGTILKASDLGKRVAGSVGAEEELSHVVWADKVERLAGDIPDTNNLLVASIRKKLPRPLQKLVGLKPMTWKEFADTVRSITLEELLEKIEDERDLARYRDAPAVPNTSLKALGAAFQNMNVTSPTQPQRTTSTTTSTYQPARTQPTPRSSYSGFIDRPIHERLADVLSKALPIQPNNPEGVDRYHTQISVWESNHGQSGKGPSETRPFPLTPGSCPVASGECWTCGQRSHHPAPCSSPRLPQFETKWRSIAATIRKRAETAAANVNIITVPSDEVQDYDPEELAHLQQLINQGKAEGSST